MTIEEAERLGLWVKWESVRCQSCDKYVKIPQTERFGALIVCDICLPKLQKAEAERLKHPSLFDGRLF